MSSRDFWSIFASEEFFDPSDFMIQEIFNHHNQKIHDLNKKSEELKKKIEFLEYLMVDIKILDPNIRRHRGPVAWVETSKS